MISGRFVKNKDDLVVTLNKSFHIVQPIIIRVFLNIELHRYF